MYRNLTLEFAVGSGQTIRPYKGDFTRSLFLPGHKRNARYIVYDQNGTYLTAIVGQSACRHGLFLPENAVNTSL